MDDVRRSHNPLPIELLDRYLAGEATAEERAQVATWVAEDTQRISLDMLARRDEIRDPEVETAWLRTARKMGERHEPLELSAERTTGNTHLTGGNMRGERRASGKQTFPRSIAGLGSPTSQRMAWSFGAAVVVALSFFGIMQKLPDREETTRTYATQFGQQATVLLRDGTRVTLAPGSRLRLWRFGSSSRTVDLDGQAYFEVAHAAGVPFRVRTGTIVTQVLGTTFLVRHYPQDQSLHIAVAEGKVTVMPAEPGHSSKFAQVTLTAGHVGNVTDSTVVVNPVTDLTPETDWLRGRIVFRRAPVSEVLQTLTHWYGYQFKCTDSTLKLQHVTGALDAQSSASALATLETALNVSVTVVGDTVTLTPRVNDASKGTPRTHSYDVWIPNREVGR